MIKTVYLNTIEEVMAMIADQTRDEKINRLRSDYYYRGQRNVAYKMSRACTETAAQSMPSSKARSFGILPSTPPSRTRRSMSPSGSR